MHPGVQPPRPPETATPAPDPVPKARRFVEPFQIGAKAARPPATFDVALPVSERLTHSPVHMDAKTHARMTRGKLAPEARIDLHGMTVAEAHPRLNGFIADAYAAGLRLVLVITGKGRGSADHGPIPQRLGILKHQVPHWLTMPPIGPLVLQITEAHLRHGGAGAYYVYLRRAR
ncbi:MAG: DNA mismatch repair protein MutS [Rhodobacteraceae bacterium]|nr:DNA mismatch repair protein MutS [Paracoccaceae bacterium]